MAVAVLSRLKRWLLPAPLSDAEFERQRGLLLARAPIPLLWLLGKTGSGKTSVVKYLTGASEAEIGSGFRPQTERSRQFDFPNSQQPLLRFLDTRGLGEIHYDPAPDLAQFQNSAHLLLVTVRALDHALDEVVAAVRAIRQRVPSLPVLLALTCLHEAYPGAQHPGWEELQRGEGESPYPNLARSVALQRQRFAGLCDRVALLDLTQPGDGFQQPDFGGEELRRALVDLLPAAYRQALLLSPAMLGPLRDLHLNKALPLVASHSLLAATAAAAPVPWVDIPFVMAVQTRMVYQVAAVYGQPVGANTLLKMAGPLGGRLLARLALRGALKFVPYLGSAANAALAYAYTYGLGRACCWYFSQVANGHVPQPEELARVWHDQCAAAGRAWRTSESPAEGCEP